MRGPDFFIVGAPKCGTTAMADYLGQHPEIGMCERKETHYLVGNLYPRMVKRRGTRPPTSDQYLSWFASVQDRKRLGEASVWYLYAEQAPAKIAAYCPDAQIIAMLRNPVEMLPALHSEFVLQAIEPVEDFAEALALDDVRERDGVPPGFPPRSYRAAVHYAEQLRRYFDLFGRERVRVIVFDDFKARTLTVYQETCSFLGVDPGFVPDLRIINANRRARSQGFERFIKRPPERLRSVLHVASSQRLRGKVGTVISRMNTRFQPREPISGELASALRSKFAPSVDELRALLELELSSWPGSSASRS